MKARAGTATLTLIGCAFSIACGGMTDSDAAGGTGNAGGTSAGGTEDESSGGSDTGGGSSGGSSAGGAVGSGGQGAGGTQGTESCPPAPLARLFPVIGPFWFGPDPGPCSSVPEGNGYVYASGLLESSTANGGETYVRDEQGRLIEVISGSEPATYGYGPSSVTESRSTHDVVYTLSSTGYPLVAEVWAVGADEPLTYSYRYRDCRLDLREGPSTTMDRLYGYDDAGHLVTISDGASVTTFDYDCW